MILSLDGVTRKFGSLVAVNNFSFDVKENEICGLIGPNGSGKTTLLNVIAGVYKPNTGKVIFRGKNIAGISPQQVCRKGISRTFQIPRSFRQMTVLENVLVASTFGNTEHGSKRVEIAENMLKLVGFSQPSDTLASNLNVIELKRLGLARALASGCKLLLADEMAAGLVPGEIPDVMKLFKEIRELGITIIVVEHIMQFVMQVCDRVVVLDSGSKIAAGTPGEICNDEEVTRVYLGAECNY